MDLAEYKDTLNKSNQIAAQNLADLAVWMPDRGLPWLWSELSSITGQNAKSMSPENAIRQGLETPPVERREMPLKPSFYIAHMTMLDAEANRVCTAAIAFGKRTNSFAPNATILELQNALKIFLLDGLFL